MGKPTVLMNGLWSTLAVCLLVVSCLTVVDCSLKLSKLASNRRDILLRSRRDEECDGSRCLNGGTCTHWFIGIEFCTCPVPYAGRYCELEDTCSDNLCLNGGSCLPDVTDLVTGSTLCLCQEGWSGLNCEIASTTSSCMSDTCRNGGTCFTFEGFSFCDCASGFTGFQCEHVDICSTKQCPESHVCVNILGVGHCVCVHGVTGTDCVIDTDGNNGCANNDPCLNGGTCDDTAEPGFIICRCPWGYEGLYCEKAITSSLPCNNHQTPCANGGTCEQFGSNYYCHCTTEYFGENCTESIFYPFCLNYCENGGSCYIDESTPQCACTPSWEGLQCTIPKHHTSTNGPVTISLQCLYYCNNGGSCYISGSGPLCTCTPSWKGRHCSVPRSISTTTTAVRYCTLKCGDYGECRLSTNGNQYCRCNSGWNGDKCQNKEDIATDTPPASGSSVGALVGGSIGVVLLLFIILVAILVMIKVSRATRNRQRQQSHPHAVGNSNSVVYNPRLGNENGGFVHAQATPHPSSLPAKDLYGSNQASGSNMPRRYNKNAAQNNNYAAAKEPSVVRNPASAYQYPYGAPPPARKTSRSSVPPDIHEYAYASGDYQPLRPPTATGPPPPYSGAPSIAGSAAPSIAASAEHTYQSLSEFGDTNRSNKQ